MTRILLAALTIAAIAGPALADIHHGPARMHKPVAPHHPIHCVVRHHHKVCAR